MEKEIVASPNSPIILKNTPIRRLGLSRKRKSCSETNVNPKIQKIKLEKELEKDDNNKFVTDHLDTEKGEATQDEPALVKKRIADKEERLKSLQWNKNKISELEGLIEVWKNGCRSAFVHLNELLKERQSEVNFKSVLSNLGVWETIVENFENDSEICLSDYSQ